MLEQVDTNVQNCIQYVTQSNSNFEATLSSKTCKNHYYKSISKFLNNPLRDTEDTQLNPHKDTVATALNTTDKL